MKKHIEKLNQLLAKHRGLCEELARIKTEEAEAKMTTDRILADGVVSKSEAAEYGQAVLATKVLPTRRAKCEDAVEKMSEDFYDALESAADQWNKFMARAWDGRKAEMVKVILPWFKRIGPPDEDDPRDPLGWIEKRMPLADLPTLRELARLHWTPSGRRQGGKRRPASEMAADAEWFIKLHSAWEPYLGRLAEKAG